MPPNQSAHILIIGAGITALQTATILQTHGYTNITLLAEHLPGDEHPLYTSPWAGGQWRSHAHEGEEEQQGWDRATYWAWMGMVRHRRGHGLGRVPSTLYWSAKGEHHDWWYDTVEDFTIVPAVELPPGIHSGVRFSTICIDVPKHLQFLLSGFEAEGGRVVKARVNPFSEQPFEAARKIVGGHVDCFVNATGIGAKDLAGDENIFPVKGQTVLVKGESKFAVTKDEIRYVIPRPGSGTTILGGTREVDVWNTYVCDETTKAILEGCKELAPELLNDSGEFEVLGVQCGLRPGRKGGPRVEYELVDRNWPVIHTYGHAGAGYQNAIGSARKVLHLLNEMLEELSNGIYRTASDETDRTWVDPGDSPKPRESHRQ